MFSPPQITPKPPHFLVEVKYLVPVANYNIFLLWSFMEETLVEWEGVFWESGRLGRGFPGQVRTLREQEGIFWDR